MEPKPDWSKIEDEEDEGEYDEQGDQGEEGQQGEKLNDSQGQRGPSSYDRPPGYRGRGGRGGSRGGRGKGRGGDRGGSRGGSRGGGPGGFGGPRRDDRPQAPRESQPKEEMLRVVKHSQEKTTLINLFNVDYNAKEDDIQKLYPDIDINEINMIKPGIFLLDLDNDQATRFIEIGTKSFNNRPFFMKIGFTHKKQNPDEQWHHVNAGNYKHETGHREDRQKRGGGYNSYNRRDQTAELNEGSFPQRNYQNRPRPENQEPVQIDPDNKFFKGHDLTAKEFNIKFTKSTSSTKKDEAGDNQPKPSKPNPFGGAVARDESEYQKRKDEEKTQVKDLQEHFEEKKEELPKDEKKLSTPVNSPNTEFVEGQVQKDEVKTQAPPGISQGKGQKKPSGQDAKNKPTQPQTKGKNEPQPKGGDKNQKPKETRKNIFANFDGEEEDDE